MSSSWAWGTGHAATVTVTPSPCENSRFSPQMSLTQLATGGGVTMVIIGSCAGMARTEVGSHGDWTRGQHVP